MIALVEERIGEISKEPEVALSRVDPLDDDDIRSAQEDLKTAQQDLLVLQAQVPSNRPNYRWAERLIDAIRVLPPIVLSLVALLYYFAH